MTHDELLKELDEVIKDFDQKYDNSNPYYKALRAVVKLHKPIKSTRMIDICEVCIFPIADGAFMHREYPCPTIRAIEKELA